MGQKVVLELVLFSVLVFLGRSLGAESVGVVSDPEVVTFSKDGKGNHHGKVTHDVAPCQSLLAHVKVPRPNAHSNTEKCEFEIQSALVRGKGKHFVLGTVIKVTAHGFSQSALEFKVEGKNTAEEVNEGNYEYKAAIKTNGQWVSSTAPALEQFNTEITQGKEDPFIVNIVMCGIKVKFVPANHLTGKNQFKEPGLTFQLSAAASEVEYLNNRKVILADPNKPLDETSEYMNSDNDILLRSFQTAPQVPDFDEVSSECYNVRQTIENRCIKEGDRDETLGRALSNCNYILGHPHYLKCFSDEVKEGEYESDKSLKLFNLCLGYTCESTKSTCNLFISESNDGPGGECRKHENPLFKFTCCNGQDEDDDGEADD